MTAIRTWWVWLVTGVMLGCGTRASEPVGQPPLTPATGSEIRRIALGAGAPVVVVNLWASWCGPCREEFPDLLRLRKVYAARGLRLVLVSGDTDPEAARRYLLGQGISFPSYLKQKTQSDPQFIDGLEPTWGGLFPSTFIYDGKGRLRESFEGKQTYAVFEAAVRKLFEDKQP